MPNVVIEWVEGRDNKMKAAVASGIVEVLQQVAGVPPSSVNILFRDYGAEEWFVGTESIAALRARRSTT
jgi:phenylpyruvate tautomerase PptA (4-oxalocrotonate tautomerase family)